MKFNHIPLVRRELLQKKRREKKLLWMQQMYKQGTKGGGNSKITTASMSEQGDNNHMQEVVGVGEDGEEGSNNLVLDDLELMEDEDALLKWSENLDFDDYYSDWIKQSCSNGSETIIPLPTKEYHKKATIDSFRAFEREDTFEREVE